MDGDEQSRRRAFQHGQHLAHRDDATAADDDGKHEFRFKHVAAVFEWNWLAPRLQRAVARRKSGFIRQIDGDR